MPDRERSRSAERPRTHVICPELKNQLSRRCSDRPRCAGFSIPYPTICGFQGVVGGVDGDVVVVGGAAQREASGSWMEVPITSAEDFESWVSPHLRSMALLAARLAGGADRDDLVQDALTRAWQKRHTYDPARGSVRVWLLAIVADRARRSRRSRRVRRRDVRLVADSSTVAGPEERGRRTGGGNAAAPHATRDRMRLLRRPVGSRRRGRDGRE